jgi:protein-disulfide isomerase
VNTKRAVAWMGAWMLILIMAGTAAAGVDWTSGGRVDLGAKAKDVTVSLDGQYVFFLVPGAVRVYSTEDHRFTDRIPVDPSYDRIAVTGTDRLVLTGTTTSQAAFINLVRRQQIDTRNRPSLGPADAPVTIVVFDDYQCPYCARLEPTLESIMDAFKGKVRLVIKNYPLITSHQHAYNAAMASMAAFLQHKFWAYHKALFADQSALGNARFEEIAKHLGLNMAQFNKDRHSPELQKWIQEDIINGRRIGVHGTPTVFINGMHLANRSLESFSAAIDAELKKSAQ